MANIVEVVVQTKEQGSAIIGKTTESLSELGQTATSTGSLLGKVALGVTAAFAAFKSLGGIVHDIEEAQAAAAQLDSAYKATGTTLGRTREQLDDLATSIQKNTTYNDELVKTAESILLTFDKVRGDAFERTIKAATDLGARLGTDLPTATRMLGRALQEPEQGLQALRRAGVTFSDEQVKLVKNFVDTGHAADAQNFILAEVERRFGGAAAAARNTLGGALTGLKNSFGDLFESTTKGTSGAVSAVNDLTKTLENPKLKGAIDSLISGIATVAEKIIQVSTGLIGIFSKPMETERQKIEDEMARIQKALEPKNNPRGGAQATSPDDIVLGGGARGITRANAEKILDSLQAKLEALKKTTDDNKTAAVEADDAFMQWYKTWKSAQDIRDQLPMPIVTSQQRIVNPWLQFAQDTLDANNEVNASFQEMFNNFPIEADKAYNEVTTKLEEHAKHNKRITEDLTLDIKKAWQGAGESIQSTLSDAFYSASFSLKDFANIFKRALADIAAAIVSSGIKELLSKEISNSGGSSGDGSWGSLLGAFFSSFAAGGGKTDKPTMVGESGPEIVTADGGGMRTYNARQLAFAAGGGGGVNFAPQYNMNVTGAQNDQEILRQMQQFVLKTNADSQREMLRLLNRNGYAVRT